MKNGDAGIFPVYYSLKRGDTSQENLPGWLLFVGIKIRLNVLKIRATNSCIFSPLLCRLASNVNTG